MERNEIKQIFQAFEYRSLRILDMTAFIAKISEDDRVDELGRYIYIITDQLKTECNKLENIRTTLESIYLD